MLAMIGNVEINLLRYIISMYKHNGIFCKNSSPNREIT